VQLAAPRAFLHGAPHAPRLRYRGKVREGGAGGALQERVEVDCAELGGGARLASSGALLPGTVSRLVSLLSEAQAGEYELRAEPLDRHSAWLNLPPPPPPQAAAQPLAKLVVQTHGRAEPPLDTDGQPPSVDRLVCKGGSLHLVC